MIVKYSRESALNILNIAKNFRNELARNLLIKLLTLIEKLQNICQTDDFTLCLNSLDEKTRLLVKTYVRIVKYFVDDLDEALQKLRNPIIEKLVSKVNHKFLQSFKPFFKNLKVCKPIETGVYIYVHVPQLLGTYISQVLTKLLTLSTSNNIEELVNTVDVILDLLTYGYAMIKDDEEDFEKLDMSRIHHWHVGLMFISVGLISLLKYLEFLEKLLNIEVPEAKPTYQ